MLLNTGASRSAYPASHSALRGVAIDHGVPRSGAESCDFEYYVSDLPFLGTLE